MSGIFLNLISAGEASAPIKYELFTWGKNNAGQLGLGNTTNYNSPKQVGALKTWEILPNQTYQHTASITSDGFLWTWGLNFYFQPQGTLGLNNGINYSSPKQVGALKTWATIGGSSSSEACCATKTDGTFWTWGLGASGRLGLGDTVNRSSPTQVGALTNWSFGSFGSQMLVATKTDGTLWVSGSGSGGRLGLGNTTSYSSPKQIGGLTNWAKVVPFSTACLAIKTDGTLWGWGRNNYGQLGLGNTTYYSSPKQVGALTTWDKIAAHYGGGIAITTSGTLFTWGRNNSGQLGLGNTTNYNSPKQVGSLTTWEEVSAGREHCFALKNP